MKHAETYKKWLLLTPTVCVLLFIAFYIIASDLYPGGSYLDKAQPGYSWRHNYLCNLVGRNALNGMVNASRNIAILSVMILGFGIGYFYYVFPKVFEMRKIWRIITRITGVSSMFFAVFLFTDRHDLVLNISGVLGVLAISATMVALARNNSFGLLWLGAFCCLLIITNAYIYYTTVLYDFLPLIQKFTILSLLIWVVSINLTFVRTAFSDS